MSMKKSKKGLTGMILAALMCTGGYCISPAYAGNAIVHEGETAVNVYNGEITDTGVWESNPTGPQSGHTATIEGTVTEDVFGGYSSDGEASNNAVIIGNVGGPQVTVGTVKGGQGGTEASNNTITIQGDVAFLGDNASIYGGVAYAFDAEFNPIGIANNNTINILSPISIPSFLEGGQSEGGTSSGNTLNIGASGVIVGSGQWGGGLNSFQNLNFYLPTNITTSDTMLTVNGEANVTNAKIGVLAQGTLANLVKNNKVTLLSATTLTGGDSISQTTDISVPTSITTVSTYEFSVATESNNIVATLTNDGSSDSGSGSSDSGSGSSGSGSSDSGSGSGSSGSGSSGSGSSDSGSGSSDSGSGSSGSGSSDSGSGSSDSGSGSSGSGSSDSGSGSSDSGSGSSGSGSSDSGSGSSDSGSGSSGSGSSDSGSGSSGSGSSDSGSGSSGSGSSDSGSGSSDSGSGSSGSGSGSSDSGSGSSDSGSGSSDSGSGSSDSGSGSGSGSSGSGSGSSGSGSSDSGSGSSDSGSGSSDSGNGSGSGSSGSGSGSSDGGSSGAIIDSETAKANAKSVVETRAATTTFINAGADMLASQGFAQAANAVALDTAQQQQSNGGAPVISSFTPYAALGGSSMRAESGSHVDTKGFGLNVGFAREIANSQGKLLFGPLVEYGGGKYDSYLDNGTHGDGGSHYWGIGLMARQINHDGFYYEGSIRGGRVNSDYNGGFNNQTVKYDSTSSYFAAHVGLGKVKNIGHNNTLDGYMKYFFSHQGGDNVTMHGSVSGDESWSFDSVNSHRLRLGARLTHRINDRNSFYGGLAYQYEFGGEATAHYNGGSTPSPSVKGGSGMLELGWQVKPGGPVSIDFGVTGWIGKQRGGSVQLGATWSF